MTVYVDNMCARFAGMIVCHMIASTEAELHAMAERIGISRRWYQGDCYEISQTKRAKAIACGAVEIELRQAAAMRRRLQETGTMGEPHDAVQWLQNWIRSNENGK